MNLILCFILQLIFPTQQGLAWEVGTIKEEVKSDDKDARKMLGWSQS